MKRDKRELELKEVIKTRSGKEGNTKPKEQLHIYSVNVK